MAIQIQPLEGNLRAARVTGLFNDNECHDLQGQLIKDIEALGTVKILLVLDGFGGWDESQAWDGSTFMEENDPFIKGIAIVGDPQWQDQVYMFTAKGFRPVPIEYFTLGKEDEARSWLDSL